jgi:hypothetical protein
MQWTMTIFDVVIVTPNPPFGLFLSGAPISTPKSAGAAADFLASAQLPG